MKYVDSLTIPGQNIVKISLFLKDKDNEILEEFIKEKL